MPTIDDTDPLGIFDGLDLTRVYDPKGYDQYGYDRYGYDPDGFDPDGYDRSNVHRDA